MKKIHYLIIIGIFMFTGIMSQINMTSNGFITIGSTANAVKTLDVRGNAQFLVYGSAGAQIYAYYGSTPAIDPLQNNTGALGAANLWNWANITTLNYVNLFKMSDENLKENITDIKNALNTIKQIKGVKYDYKKGFLNFGKSTDNSDFGITNQYGFIAQQVQTVLPAAVSYDTIHKIYSVSYESIIPFLVEAMKEQQAQIDSLNQLLNKKSDGSLKNAFIPETTTTEIIETVVKASLDQNAPNPFSQSTMIGYYLPNTVTTATLNIYNMSGVPVKSITVIQKGRGSITIRGYELNPGMYLYTLIADGKEVDTKRMILTE
jgi:hypothetical protein